VEADTACRDAQLLAPARSSIHIPPQFLPPTHLLRLESRLHAASGQYLEASLHVRLRSLSRRVRTGFNTLLLPRRPVPGPWCRRPARSTTSARALRPLSSDGAGGGARIWILLRRLDARVLPPVRPTVHHSVHPDAGHRSQQQGKHVCGQHPVFGGRGVLESDHVFGLQQLDLFAPYAASACTSTGDGVGLAGMYHQRGQP